MAKRDHYDVIIVGGGVAGLVAAARLSEDPSKNVLLIEAGKDRRGDPNIDTPGRLVATWGNKDYEWDYYSVPQTELNGRQIPQPKGKVLGGSSAINAMALLFPTTADFSRWTQLGNRGWTATEMAPYYRKSMTFHHPPEEAVHEMGLGEYMKPELYGDDGPIAASFAHGFGPIDVAFVRAFDQTGLGGEKHSDPIQGEFCGSFLPPTSVDPIKRERSYAIAYVEAAAKERTNLELLCETLVDQIVLERDADGSVEAKGVRVLLMQDGGRAATIRADEVILAAGSLHTPPILERSGIGARDVLERLGIDVVVENPGVGENLQDHVFASISLEVVDGLITRDHLRDPTLVAALVKQYDESRSGPLAGLPLDYAFIPAVDAAGRMSRQSLEQLVEHVEGNGNSSSSRSSRLPPAGLDAQLNLLRNATLDPRDTPLYGGMLTGQLTVNPTGKTGLVEFHTPRLRQNFTSLFVGLNHPLSRGSVHLASRDPFDPPVIDPAYLTNPLDLELLARALQFLAGPLVEQDAMRKVLKPGGLRLPAAAVDNAALTSADLEVARQVVRERAWTNYHPSCTCPMMPRELGGVVDDRLRVYGVKNVRIIDASVFPMITTGNIQATVYAVAERACDLIKEDWTASAEI